MSTFVASPLCFCSAAKRFLACSTPMMLSGVSFHTGMRVWPLFSTLATMSFGSSVAVDHRHLGAVNHDVGDFEVLHGENAAQHVAVVLDDRAFLVMKVDGAAQFLMRRKDCLRLSISTPNAPEHQLDDVVQRVRLPRARSTATSTRMMGATRHGHAVGMAIGIGLRAGLGRRSAEERESCASAAMTAPASPKMRESSSVGSGRLPRC